MENFAFSSSIMVRALPDIDFSPECSPLVSLDSHHPDALEQIQTLENKGAKLDAAPSDVPVATSAPSFSEHLADQKCDEGDTVTLECKVVPKGDPELNIGEKHP